MVYSIYLLAKDITLNHKTRELADSLVATISAWEDVDCITLNEAAMTDILDPYFALILDVYHHGNIPDVSLRKEAYGLDVAAFETSPLQTKDRFLVKGLPVRIELKLVERVEDQITIALDPASTIWDLHRTGTYMFYRLQKGEILYKKTSWIRTVQERLSAFPPSFWVHLRRANESRMEHYVSDLGASVAQEDDFHYLIASAGFVKHACMALFCINGQFEPSHRAYLEQVSALKKIPDEFNAGLEALLNSSGDMPPERRFSLAQLIARSIMAL